MLLFFPLHITLPLIERAGYETCKEWLKGSSWQEILPCQEPPPPGEEAVKAFGPHLTLSAREEFIRGWDRRLAECGLI